MKSKELEIKFVVCTVVGSQAVVQACHTSYLAAERDAQASKNRDTEVFRLILGAFGGRTPKIGETVGLYQEGRTTYAVCPR